MPTPEAPCFELLMITINLPKEPQRERPGVQQNQIDPLAARIVRKVPPSARCPTPIGFWDAKRGSRVVRLVPHFGYPIWVVTT